MATSPATPNPRRRQHRLEELLDACTTALGQPLHLEARDRIRALDRQPTTNAWADAYSIVIRDQPLLTLWQAVTLVDPRCPTVLPLAGDGLDQARRWRGYHPTRLILRIALRRATTTRTTEAG